MRGFRFCLWCLASMLHGEEELTLTSFSVLYLDPMDTWMSLHLHWDLLPLRNPVRLQSKSQKHQQGTPYKRQITQFTCYSDRAEIKADCWGMARHSDSKWLLDKYATALLLRHYKEQFKQWKIRFLSNRLSIVQ